MPQVIRVELGTPDAIVVETSGGGVFVVADPAVTDDQLDVITLAAEHLPRQRIAEHDRVQGTERGRHRALETPTVPLPRTQAS